MRTFDNLDRIMFQKKNAILHEITSNDHVEEIPY